MQSSNCENQFNEYSHHMYSSSYGTLNTSSNVLNCGSVHVYVWGPLCIVSFPSIQIQSIGVIITDFYFKPLGVTFFLLHYSGSTTSNTNTLLCKMGDDGSITVTHGNPNNQWYNGTAVFLKY